jgi:glutamate carboxypeptidase
VKRYGRGTYQIIAHGAAAHSGSNPHLAVSPLTELARQLLRIEAWNGETDLATFAPVSISGGIGETCMIPETAHFTMDVRYKEENTGAAIHEQIMALKPITPGVRLEVKGTLDKPVMREYPRLFEKARACGRAFDLDLKGVTIGGGSDGNFTSAAGVPTLDGLGTTGEFLHNPREYIHVGHIPRRTAMLAKLLESL